MPCSLVIDYRFKKHMLVAYWAVYVGRRVPFQKPLAETCSRHLEHDVDRPLPVLLDDLQEPPSGLTSSEFKCYSIDLYIVHMGNDAESTILRLCC